MLFKLILISLFLLLSEVVYLRLARRYKIVDEPTARSSHGETTVHGGGIIFLLGAWLCWAFFGFEYPWFLAALTLVGIVSFLDDIRPLTVKVRLVAQFIAIGALIYQAGFVTEYSWAFLIAALVVGVGIVNAYNFMDGINGITAAYSLAVLAPLLYLNTSLSFISPPFLYITAISIAVFSVFNFRSHAKCFAGDVGAISMAFILLFALAMLILKTQQWSYLALMAVYGVDAGLTLCRRIYLRENIGQPHRKHAYQLLANECKMPQRLVAVIYMGLQLAVSAGFIFCHLNHLVYLAVVIIILSAAYFAFIRYARKFS